MSPWRAAKKKTTKKHDQWKKNNKREQFLEIRGV